MAHEVLFTPHNHFDPTWRRCFDRSAHKHGVTVRSYAEVEELVIDAWLALAPDGYPCDEGQAAVWRKYLERNPERVDELRALAADGTLNVVLAGETVQDSVMPAAEGLVRNFLVAMPMYEKLVSRDHPGLRMAWCEDAFGNSPNYPQVLKGVGAEVACKVSYRHCPDETWIGIDGTRIPLLDSHYSRIGGCWVYHPPCAECRGEGCDVCDDTGMTLRPYARDWMRTGPEAALNENDGKDWVAIGSCSEEGIPDRVCVDAVQQLQARYGKDRIRFATHATVFGRLRDRLLKQAEEAQGAPHDLNPGMPGCLVTRIKLKQRVREVTALLTAAEAALATDAWQAGAPASMPEALREGWRNLVFNHFHDAITGTHIDSATTELMEMLDIAEAAAGGPRPAVAATGSFASAASLPARKTLGVLDVAFDLQGILAITSGANANLFAESQERDLRRPLRIGELTIEEDGGDAWGKRTPGSASITWDSSGVLLGHYHKRVEVADDAIRWYGVYDGGDPRVETLAWTTTARAAADGQRIEFTTEVDWDTHSRRLRAVFPFGSGDTATWEVPFGFIERTYDPEKVHYDMMTIDTQEYGALHWVWKALEGDSGVALFNRGLPCHRYTSGCLDLSLVRSPEFGFGANMPVHYEFHDIDGQRDSGKHCFEYALQPYWNGITPGELTRIGYRYNRHEIVPPFEIGGDIVVTAWKPAESGDGWVLRLHEANGGDTDVVLNFGAPCRVTRTNLLEEPVGESRETAVFTTPLHKHGILTVKIER